MSVTMSKKPGFGHNGLPAPEEPTKKASTGPGGMPVDVYEHPGFALATVNRVTAGGRGVRLHGSDFGHGSFVRLEIHTSREDRHLKRTWRMAEKHLITVNMSEVQWGQLVSSFGQGGGVPVTLDRLDNAGVPEILGSNDAKKLVVEVKNAATEATNELREAMAVLHDAVAAGKIGPIKAALRDAEIKLSHVPANMKFAADTTVEFLEEMVGTAKAEINAHVMHVMMDNAGLLGDSTVPLLTVGDDKEGEI